MNVKTVLIARNLSGDLVIAAEADKPSQLVSILDTKEFIESFGETPEFGIYPQLGTPSYTHATRRRDARYVETRAKAAAKAKAKAKAEAKAAKDAAKPAKTLEDVLD